MVDGVVVDVDGDEEEDGVDEQMVVRSLEGGR